MPVSNVAISGVCVSGIFVDLLTRPLLWTGVVAVEECGGPPINFRAGRTDADSGEESPPNDRLPNADMGSRVSTTNHVREVFSRMGFNDQVGQCWVFE